MLLTIMERSDLSGVTN